nr:hypothetical protein [Prevotella sp.]
MEEIQEIQKEESDDETDSGRFKKKNQTEEIQEESDDERDSESSKEEKGDVTRIPEPTRKHIFLLMYH